MTKQTVNTDGIASAAAKLKNINSAISFIFGSLEYTAKKLDDDWTGRAAEAARAMRHQVFKGNEKREAVLQGYVDTLMQKVDPGYREAEKTNKSLADEFK